jgi:hypothetical protein
MSKQAPAAPALPPVAEEETRKMSLDTYGRLELLGHRVLYGHLSEEEIAGVQFVAIDVCQGGEVRREYYGTASIYCIAPLSEQEVLDATRQAPRRIAVASYADADDDSPHWEEEEP